MILQEMNEIEACHCISIFHNIPAWHNLLILFLEALIYWRNEKLLMERTDAIGNFIQMRILNSNSHRSITEIVTNGRDFLLSEPKY